MANQKRIADAGEKIDGARKDFYTNPLSHTDLEQMNDQEKLVLVTRDHIWPSKPLEAFQKEGVDCDVALFVRGLRKAVPPNIMVPDQAPTFIELVTKVRDCAALLKTSEAIIKSNPSQFQRALVDAGILQSIQYDGCTEYKLTPKYKELLQHCEASGLAVYLKHTYNFYFCSNYDALHGNASGPWIYPSQMNSNEMYEFIL